VEAKGTTAIDVDIDWGDTWGNFRIPEGVECLLNNGARCCWLRDLETDELYALAVVAPNVPDEAVTAASLLHWLSTDSCAEVH